MTDYSALYDDLRAAGYTERQAAEMVDLAVCEDALARRLGREPTAKEVEREYEQLWT